MPPTSSDSCKSVVAGQTTTPPGPTSRGGDIGTGLIVSMWEETSPVILSTVTWVEQTVWKIWRKFHWPEWYGLTAWSIGLK